MHNPFKAFMELCVLGRQDYFCLEENVVYSGGVISVGGDSFMDALLSHITPAKELGQGWWFATESTQM